jgi:dienelactone hydrolase
LSILPEKYGRAVRRYGVFVVRAGPAESLVSMQGGNMREMGRGVGDDRESGMSRREFIRGAGAVTAGVVVLQTVAKNDALGAEPKASPVGGARGRINVERLEIKGDGFNVPAVILSPQGSSRAAVIVHGYGGCKEEQLGLAWRVAERGITACAIDLRGHGEHPLPLIDEKVALDLGAAVRHCRSYGKVVVIGHSLGGRLALLGDADFVIAISPALNSVFSPQTSKLLKELRGYRVREAADGTIFDIFRKLPVYKPSKRDSILIVYGERDVPEVKEGCSALAPQGEEVVRIDRALHADIFLLESTFKRIGLQLDEWSGKM